MTAEYKYDDYQKKQLTGYLDSVRHRLSSYSVRIISYLGIRNSSGIDLILARIVYDCVPPTEKVSFVFESRSIVARTYLEVVPKDETLEQLAARPEISSPDGLLKFAIDEDRQLSAYQVPIDPDTTFNFQSVPALRIYFDDRKASINRLKGAEIKTELKTGDSPFNDIGDLVSALGLADLLQDTSNPIIEIKCGQPAIILGNSQFTEEGFEVLVRVSKSVDPRLVKVGFKTYGSGIKRGVVSLHPLDKHEMEGALDFKATVRERDIAGIQLYLSLQGDLIHQLFQSNPARTLNVYSGIYKHIDANLEHLRNLLFNSGSKSREFEKGVSFLAEILGFITMHFGSYAPFEQTFDIAAISPAGTILLVECATDVVSIQEKLSKLVNRRSRMESHLKTQGWISLNIQPVFVTPLSADVLKADHEYAGKHNVAMIHKEELIEMLNGIDVPLSPDLRISRIRGLVPKVARPDFEEQDMFTTR